MGQILLGKDNHLANRFADLVAPLQFHKEPLQAFRGNLRYRCFRVQTTTRAIEGGVADIAGENLHYLGCGRSRADVASLVPHVFNQGNRDGVRFFAGRTSGDPNADRPIVRFSIAKEDGKHSFSQRVEGFTVAEKSSDVDEDIAVKLIHLSLILLDEANVVLQFFEPVAHHAALDAALKSSLLVMGKIYSRGVTQKRKEIFQFVASRNGRGIFALGDCGRGVGMTPDSDELFSDLLRRSDKV